jgi:hypothetical protein
MAYMNILGGRSAEYVIYACSLFELVNILLKLNNNNLEEKYIEDINKVSKIIKKKILFVLLEKLRLIF